MTTPGPLLTTREAAYLAGVDPRTFARWARYRHITPADHIRRGRSTITLWSLTTITAALGDP